MPTEHEAIIEAFRALGGTRSIAEVGEWLHAHYDDAWKDIGTTMADMVPEARKGNSTSTIPDEYRVLVRVERGCYRLAD